MCQFCERAKSQLDDPYGASQSAPLSAAARMEAERCSALRSRRTPVTVICGFLGSGKTTLLNHVLRAPHGLRLAVLENEVGAVAVDDELLSDAREAALGPEVVLMPNGCLCCRTRGDLRDALRRLVERQQRAAGDGGGGGGAGGGGEGAPPPLLDGIIMELSGASEVAPVLQTFFADDFVQGALQLDSVVCVCDAPRLAQQLLPPQQQRGDELSAEVGAAAAAAHAITAEQLALADTVLLNKADLVDPDTLAALRASLSASMAAAAVTECVRGAVDVRRLLNTGAFSLSRAVAADDAFLAGGSYGNSNGGGGGSGGHDGSGAAGDGDGSSGGGGSGGSSGHDHRAHGHGHRPHAHAAVGLRTAGAEHSRGAVDTARVVDWAHGVAAAHGAARVWRIKGVLWGDGAGGRGALARRVVLQGVGGHVEVEEGDWPPGRPRRSRIVLIGPLSDELEAELREALARVFEPVAAAPPLPFRRGGWSPAPLPPPAASAAAAAAQRPAAVAAHQGTGVVSGFGGAKAAARHGLLSSSAQHASPLVRSAHSARRLNAQQFRRVALAVLRACGARPSRSAHGLVDDA
ncbi:CobW/HypB/UreG, nucleotide-binding domain-containing protein [Tribonema minus]|uniref:CobW/HypB/UreG, nucleotide-binding domain-containing protein n=1 Tax=Tribonema minus TaxID=303371 RepID=A0A835ZKA2_9STRA|nr:CobW/HypB/UreG, nucleotide-binding domain-containing protein [Tribonema minus]